MTRIELLRRITERHQAERIRVDGSKVYVDSFTARAMVAVYEALSPLNREKYIALPWPKFVRVTWALVERNGGAA